MTYDDDAPKCWYCHCEVPDDADMWMYGRTRVYTCGECLEALREAKADADRDDRLMEDRR